MKKINATFTGIMAILIWAEAPLLITWLKNIPAAEILSISLSVSTMLFALKLTVFNGWKKILCYPALWIAGIIGVASNDLCYILAMQNAPAVHVEMLNYLWPLLFVLFIFIVPGEKFKPRYLIACLISLYAIYLLLNHQTDFNHINTAFIQGYKYALLGAAGWTIYMLVVSCYPKAPYELIGVYCGVSAIIMMIYHYNFEPWVKPTPAQWWIILVIGCFNQCIAFSFWEKGMKNGMGVLISTLSYSVPLLSSVLLVSFHVVKPSPLIWVSGILIFLSGLIIVYPSKKLNP